MSDRNSADELTAIFEQAALTFEDAFYADRYEIYRDITTRDNRGGRTTESNVLAESGRCSLTAVNQAGQEGPVGGRIIAITKLAADLPLTSTVVPSDRIEINGRKFNITNVSREGNWGTSVTVDLEEPR